MGLLELNYWNKNNNMEMNVSIYPIINLFVAYFVSSFENFWYFSDEGMQWNNLKSSDGFILWHHSRKNTSRFATNPRGWPRTYNIIEQLLWLKIIKTLFNQNIACMWNFRIRPHNLNLNMNFFSNPSPTAKSAISGSFTEWNMVFSNSLWAK